MKLLLFFFGSYHFNTYNANDRNDPTNTPANSADDDENNPTTGAQSGNGMEFASTAFLAAVLAYTYKRSRTHKKAK